MIESNHQINHDQWIIEWLNDQSNSKSVSVVSATSDQVLVKANWLSQTQSTSNASYLPSALVT